MIGAPASAMTRAQRLQWFGHIKKIHETRLPKIRLKSVPRTNRLTERLRIKWIDKVGKDLKKGRITNWTVRARVCNGYQTPLRGVMQTLNINTFGKEFAMGSY